MIPKSNVQLTNTVLMIEPVQFGFNQEAFETNSFQHRPSIDEERTIQEKALSEFNSFVEQLRGIGVNVLVYKDSLDHFTPDSIFPNNWISTHRSGELFTFPMAVPNRRNEHRNDIILELKEEFRLEHTDISSRENEHPPRFLEGTGAMIFDRILQKCYAALSPRAHMIALEQFCEMINYELVSFEAYGKNGEAIYHTNVMLSIGDSFACIGNDTVAASDVTCVLSNLKAGGREIIAFTNDQIYSHFAGNMLQVRNAKDETVLVLSKEFFRTLQSFKNQG